MIPSLPILPVITKYQPNPNPNPRTLDEYTPHQNCSAIYVYYYDYNNIMTITVLLLVSTLLF